MLRSVLTKTLYDQRRAFPAWVVGLALLVAMYVAIWPSVRDQPSMNQFLDEMPEAFRALFAMSGADMSTPVGYIEIELLSFMGPLLLLIYAVGTGAAAVAGEEERGNARSVARHAPEPRANPDGEIRCPRRGHRGTVGGHGTRPARGGGYSPTWICRWETSRRQ